MRLFLIVLAAAVLSLVGAPVALAYKVAPPGNSAVSQYVENVPGAKGNVPTLTIHPQSGPGGGSASGAVTPSTQQALVSQGTDGARAAAIAAATAPPGVGGENRQLRSGSASSAKATGAKASDGKGTGGTGTGGSASGAGASTGATPVSGSVLSPSSAVLKAVTGSATHGLGALLPVILTVSAIGTGLLAALRRRRAT